MYERIPSELKQLRQWVVWKYVPDPDRPDKPRKMPVNPHTGNNAQSNNPDTWGSLDEAIQALNKYPNIAGLGICFADGICGIDIDNKEGDADLDEQARDIIRLMDTYTEYSPSGTGYHLIFRCDISKIPTVTEAKKDKNTGETENVLKLDPVYYQKNPHNGLECYFAGLTNRFFTFTGEAVNNFGIENRTAEVLRFLDEYMRRNPKSNATAEQALEIDAAPKYNPIAVARKARNGEKFIALFDKGDISRYNNDDSSADQALCNMLAFYCRGNFNEIDSLFRESALYREKWERDDYSTNTINKAISSCGGEFYTPKGRPRKKKENEQGDYDSQKAHSDIISIQAVQNYLDGMGISLKYNVINRRADIRGFDKKYGDEHKADILPVVIHDDLKFEYERCAKGDITDALGVISSVNRYNPVLEMLEGKKWDGIDRLPELYRIMRIDNSDSLSKVLIYKWLWQSLSMARNEIDENGGAYGADGALVLQGGQGIGKTTLVRKLAIKHAFCLIGKSLNFQDKDTLRRCGSAWIVELGEIETTFKSDKEKLKAFITDEIDMYRLPYGRADVELARRTSLIGTCNSTEYLIDETGNRRFWTVPIAERMDLDAIEKFDALQLWLQIDQAAKKDIQGFRLTEAEQAALAERNGRHEKPLKSEIEVRDILSMLYGDNRCVEKEVTVTEFKSHHRQLDKFDAREIGKVLDKMGITMIRTKKGRFRTLPMLAEDYN